MLFCGTSFSANFIYADYYYKYKGEKVSPKIANSVFNFFYYMAFIFDGIKQVKDEIALKELGVVLSLYSQLSRG